MKAIHPNDIITMDLNSISYLTLKNGDMILIDESVPEKENKENTKHSKSTTSKKKDSKIIQKKYKLKISTPCSFYFEGIKFKNNMKDKEMKKVDYIINNKIIKNENFFILGFKKNQNIYNNNLNNIFEKENIPMNNINNHFNIDKTSKFSYKNDNKNEFYNQTNKLKENEIPHIKNVHFNFNNNINNNDINIQSDYNQNKLSQNINTNMSIPITTSYNNNDNPINLNSNNSNINHESKRKNKSKIFGFFGKDKKVRISINAVCSLNIKAEDKYKINLINQFNNLVDRLNGEREKDSVNRLLESEKNDKYSKIYPLYKNKTHNDVIKKNFQMFNQNYNANNDFNSDINNISNKVNAFNNSYKKNNLIGFNGNNSSNNNYLLNQNARNINSQQVNDIERLKNKIQRLSSGIVRPSNKIFNL